MSASIKHIGSPLGSRGGIRSVTCGAGTVVPPTPITLSDPNFTSNGASWGAISSGITSNFANDPSGVAIAGIVTTSSTSFAQFHMRVFGTGVMTAGTTYTFTGYARKPIGGEGPSGANWLYVFVTDGVAYEYGQAFNTSTGAMGLTNVGAGAFLTGGAMAVTADSNSLWKFVLTGGFTAGATIADAYGRVINTNDPASGACDLSQNIIISRWGA